MRSCFQQCIERATIDGWDWMPIQPGYCILSIVTMTRKQMLKRAKHGAGGIRL